MRQVTAAVIVEDGRLLVARRAPGQSLEGLWELPGGKIEPNETPQECLARELAEEMAMLAHAGEVVASTVHHYDHGCFELFALQTTRLSDFELRVHDQVAWIGRDELAGIQLAPADVELVRRLSAAGVW